MSTPAAIGWQYDRPRRGILIAVRGDFLQIATDEDDLTTAQEGDREAFERLVAPLRGELHAHCYRMLGSVHDADDALQDALVRGWRSIARFEGRGTLRSWLYTVATRSCLDVIARRGRRALPVDLGPASDHVRLDAQPLDDVAWLEPYPARRHDRDAGPAARYEQREAVELAFVAALQHLTGNQRAALVLFDVVGLSAAEIATTMATSVASVNSTLQRARRIVAEKIAVDGAPPTFQSVGDERTRRIAAAFAVALENGDADALTELLTVDVTWSMPPIPDWYSGMDAVAAFAERVPMASCGSWRHLPIVANAVPAVAFYLRSDETGPYRAWSITAFTFRDDRIGTITSFLDQRLFSAFGLPSLLS